MAETLPWQTPQAVLASPMAIASQISAKSGSGDVAAADRARQQQAQEAVVEQRRDDLRHQFLALLDGRAAASSSGISARARATGSAPDMADLGAFQLHGAEFGCGHGEDLPLVCAGRYAGVRAASRQSTDQNSLDRRLGIAGRRPQGIRSRATPHSAPRRAAASAAAIAVASSGSSSRSATSRVAAALTAAT